MTVYCLALSLTFYAIIIKLMRDQMMVKKCDPSTADSSEMVEGMWLGVTVASQRNLPAGRVLVSLTSLFYSASQRNRWHITWSYMYHRGEVQSLYVPIFAVPYNSMSSSQRKRARCDAEQAHFQNR